MLKRISAVLILTCCLLLQSCTSAVGNLNKYADAYDGYQFRYPNGWVEIAVKNGPDVVFHDLIEQTENASVVISPVPGDKTLNQLGTPSEVGYKLSKNAIAPPDSGRTAELVDASERKLEDEPYYLLEYLVTLPDQSQRHNLASVVVRRGQLFTFNISVKEGRWKKATDLFKAVADSFVVY
jgi:photosystem II oxygen-evolving enhancer protein 2